VLVTKGMENTSPRGIVEAARMAVSLAYIGNEGTMRLACQTKVNGDISVTTCPSLNLFGDNFFS
jgi:ferredoxin